MDTSTDEAPEILDWSNELTTLLTDMEEPPDGFGLYLNFMYRYNIDADGEVDLDSPYKDDINQVNGEDSQTKFLLESIATKYNLQMQYAFIKDPTTDVEAGYHYGLFYIGDEIVDVFVAVREELEVNLSRLHELGKIPILPLMQFTLLGQSPPDDFEEVSDEDEDEDDALF